MEQERWSGLLEKAFERFSRPVVLPEPSGVWISALKARKLIWAETGTSERDRSAERALARRAVLIPTRVTGWSYSWEPQEGLSRLDLVEDAPDLSDWTETPSQLAYARRLEVLSCIGDDPNASILSGAGLVDACWLSGDFKVVIDGDFRRETVHLLGLGFDEVELRRSFEFPALDLSGTSSAIDAAEVANRNLSAQVPSSTPSHNPGGRPASRHGDVLSAATLRLAALCESDLNRYTVEALGMELESAYRSVGEAPPSERNRLLFAAGILRVIRSGKI